ncbi:MAG: ABC transporter ATP-binding protein/permease [Treponema sp.]|nr:ABC transporter ATP-binding protein/permease [Treponema sp.]
MVEILSRFFNFCGTKNKHKFYLSIFIGIINSLFIALRIGAVAIMLRGIIISLQEGSPFTAHTIWLSFSVMLISITGTIITKKIMSMLQTEAGYDTCATKRIEIAEHLRYLPMGYFNANSLGYITSVTTNTMELLGDIATRAVMLITQGILDTTLIIIMIAFFNWRIALVATGGFIFFLVINTLMRLNVQAASAEKSKSDSEIVEQVLEYIQGIAEVKAYNMTGRQAEKLNKAIAKATQTNIAMEFSCIPLANLQSLIAKCTGIAVLLYSINLYLNGLMTLADCATMQVCSFMLFNALEAGGNYSALLRSIDLSVNKAQKILDLPTMEIEGSQFIPQSTDIEVKNVSFSYDKDSERNRPIINNVSLTIPAKTTTAVVGPSGSGKTTLCHLFARFWDADSGTITLGHKNIQDYSIDSLMKNFSFVFQNVYLFQDTIANNIRFGVPDAPIEKVIEAAKKACCHDFITALPQGYDTVIGEGGASLSGGEKQRISIARAIMKDAPIIILDEATANVDPENEQELMTAITELTKEKTVIMIAHRLKTVRHADQIIVLDNGKIVEHGKHEELIQNGGLYARFVNDRKEAVSWRL